MVKIEAFDDRCFMHQFVTLTNVRTYVRTYVYMYVCVYVCIVWVYICQSHPKVRANQMNIMKSEVQMYFGQTDDKKQFRALNYSGSPHSAEERKVRNQEKEGRHVQTHC